MEANQEITKKLESRVKELNDGTRAMRKKIDELDEQEKGRGINKLTELVAKSYTVQVMGDFVNKCAVENEEFEKTYSSIEEEKKRIWEQNREKGRSEESEQQWHQAVEKEFKLYDSNKILKNERAKQLVSMLKDYSLEEKAMVAIHFNNKNFLNFSLNLEELRYIWPSNGDACVAAHNNVTRLGIESIYSYSGRERTVTGDKKAELVSKVIGKIKDKAELEQIESVKKERDDIECKRKELREKLAKLENELENECLTLGAYKAFETSNTSVEEVVGKMPGVINLMREYQSQKLGGCDTSNICFATAKPEEETAVILTNDMHYSGYGGCAYGVTCIVWKDGAKTQEYFEWMGSRDAERNTLKNYKEAHIESVEGNKVNVILTAEAGKSEKIFFIKEDLEKKLSNEQQAKFEAIVKSESEKILDQYENNKRAMPIDATFRGLKGTMGIIGAGANTSDKIIPYDKPEIIEQIIDKEHGKSVIVIKAQIDYCGAHGKQHGWYAYRITAEKTECIASETAYQSHLERGKEIRIRAKDLMAGEKK
ncbi:hypothetical protein JW756_05710 [Candidatus Woesearchaeota archaeon]|nr:hypothetical protein [Candidatus Woesearchaeota archaeon]